MIKKLLLILENWQLHLPTNEVSKLFNRTLSLLTFLLLIQMIGIADSTWGVDHFVILHKAANWFEAPALMMSFPFWRENYWLFFYGTLFLSLLGIVGFTSVWTRAMLWFLFLNLSHGNPEIANAGWAILKQCLFFSIFLFEVPSSARSRIDSLKRLVHNLSYYGIWFQIGLLYLVAGSNKLLGNQWIDGNAMALVLSIEEYSLPIIFKSIEHNSWWLKLVTWITLGYQLSFMPLIWFRRLHWILIPVGLMFHLGVIFLLGITDFGIVMIGLYVIFLSNPGARKINQILIFCPFKSMAGINNMSGNGD
ncbi:MAG: HTTM domain-containing protein [Flavobacteriales bacterium]